MRRRQSISLLSGVAVASSTWPQGLRTQEIDH
jgi:hypothetical protein